MNAEQQPGFFTRLHERRLDRVSQKLASRAIKLYEKGYVNEMLPVRLSGNILDLVFPRVLPDEAYSRANECLAEHGIKVEPRAIDDGVELDQRMIVQQLKTVE